MEDKLNQLKEINLLLKKIEKEILKINKSIKLKL